MSNLYVVRDNLGNEFDLGLIEPNKVHLLLDNTSLKRDVATGILSADFSNQLDVQPFENTLIVNALGGNDLNYDPTTVKIIKGSSEFMAYSF